MLDESLRWWRGGFVAPSCTADSGAADKPCPWAYASAPIADSLIDAQLSGAEPVELWPEVRDRQAESGGSSLRRQLYDAYVRANQQPLVLSRPLQPRGLEVTLRDSAAASVAHPIVYLSRVGFNSRSDSAYVHIWDICGGQCGAGALLLLVRAGARWQVVAIDGYEVS